MHISLKQWFETMSLSVSRMLRAPGRGIYIYVLPLCGFETRPGYKWSMRWYLYEESIIICIYCCKPGTVLRVRIKIYYVILLLLQWVWDESIYSLPPRLYKSYRLLHFMPTDTPFLTVATPTRKSVYDSGWGSDTTSLRSAVKMILFLGSMSSHTSSSCGSEWGYHTMTIDVYTHAWVW